MIQPKITRTFLNEKPVTIYGINKTGYSLYGKYSINEKYVKSGMLNITANKLESIGYRGTGISTILIRLLFGGAGDTSISCDCMCDYETFMYYPMTLTLTEYTSLIGVQRPRNTLYPTLLDFTGLAYCSFFKDIYVATKHNNQNGSISKVMNPFLVGQSGSFLAKYLMRQDEFYFDAKTLDIKRKSDHSVFTDIPDKEIFAPQGILEEETSDSWCMYDPEQQKGLFDIADVYRNGEKLTYETYCKYWKQDRIQNYNKIKTRISRKWTDWKYYASQQKTEKYIPNEAKYNAYINSLVKEGETLLSFEPINISTTPKEDFMRYICEHGIPEYYHDYNNDFIFTVDGKKYTFDFDLEVIRDSDFNIVENIKTFNRIITMDEYIDQIKTFIGLEQEVMIDSIINSLIIGDYTFTGFGFDQYTNPTFKEGDIITNPFNSENKLLRYTKADGFVPYDMGEITDLKNALNEGFNAYEYEDNTISYNNTTNKKITQIIPNDKMSLLAFKLATMTRNLSIDYSKNDLMLTKRKIYLYERHTTKNENGLDTLDFVPILLIDGVTSDYDAVVQRQTYTFRREYIDGREKYNFANVYYDNKGAYIYRNVSTKLDPPQEVDDYIIIDENDSGNLKMTKKLIEYSAEPEIAKSNLTFIKDQTKFMLPSINRVLDRRIKTLITRFKRNEISGWFLKYTDRQGNTRIKLHQEDRAEFLKKTCDVEDAYLGILPLVPFFSTYDIVQPISTKNWAGFMLRALAAHKDYYHFYYLYDRKIQAYYKAAFKFPIKQWDRSINEDRFIDKEYKVKTPKRVSKLYTDDTLPYYNPSILQHPLTSPYAKKTVDKIPSDYQNYYSSEGHGTYGAHTAIRFTFAIFFNKYVRKTKLLNKMAIRYLDYYFDTFNGILNQQFQMYVYPADRISYPEKQHLLSFIKRELNDREIANLKAKYYSELDYLRGVLVFYDGKRKIKYEVDLNVMYPDWKIVFFPDRVFTKSSSKYDYLTIKKEDISPLKYNDVFSSNNSATIPTNVYKNIGGTYQLEVNSYYYDMPIIIKYTAKNGGTRTRTINCWKNAVEYQCFYTPYNQDSYNGLYSVNQLENFQDRNIVTYLNNYLSELPYKVIEEHYNRLFNKNISLTEDSSNIFDYNEMFSRGFLTPSKYVDFSQEVRDNVLINNPVCYIQDKDESNNVSVNLALAQTQTLYNDFKTSHLVYAYNSKNDCISEIIDYLLETELPAEKIITPTDFKRYFIDYDRNGFLAQLMTEREIYELGFINYLVSDSPNGIDDITLLLPFIHKKLGETITKIDLESSNVVQMRNFWLPMPSDVYKRLPFYCKKYVTTYFAVIETYMVRSIPFINDKVRKDYKNYQTIMRIVRIITAVISLIIAFISGNPFLVINAIFELALAVIDLIYLYATPSQRVKLQKIVRGIMIASAIINLLMIFEGLGTSGSLSGLQIAGIVTQILTLIVSLSTEVIKMVYTAKINKEYERLNEKKLEYNKSVDELHKLLEENEFSEALNRVNPTNISLYEKVACDDKYDYLYEGGTQSTLEMLYEDLESYYDRRLD